MTIRNLVAAVGLVVVVCSEAAAHQLDEYVQALRVGFTRDGFSLELDLTPGASMASTIVPMLDRDGDGAISPIEARTYGLAVLEAVVLELDGRALAATLTRVEVPSIDEIRGGLGTVQVRAVARVSGIVAGGHQLFVRNDHQPAGSVYLVNALVPDDADVGVLAQTRDRRQQAVRIDYIVGSRWPVRLLWLVIGVAGLSALAMLRKTVSSGPSAPPLNGFNSAN